MPVPIDVGLSETYPYGIAVPSNNISQVLEFFGAEVILWGNPADPAHDKERGVCLVAGGQCPAGVAEVPFLTLPRACGTSLVTTYSMDSWQNPGVWVKGFSSNAVEMTGCGQLAFAPLPDVRPTTTSAESATGLDFNLDVSDEGLLNPSGLAQADIEALSMALPQGMTANPSAAEGLGVCTLGQYQAEHLQTPAGQGCPEASKLGTIEAETPLLKDHTLHGALYLAAQGQGNPFGTLLAFYLVIRDPETGIFIKLAGEGSTDKQSGRIITTFGELPPFPLSHVGVHLRSGPRAPLVTPPACGAYATEVTLTPSSGAAAQISSPSFPITSGPGGGPCPAGGAPPFAPGFEAGATNNAAGAYSPFTMRITRRDGEQDLTRFSATLPPGVVGKVAGLAKCPDAAIAAAKLRSGREELASPSCPASSRLGSVLAGAGVGSALTYVPGSIYLAGPFGGDPLSVVAIVPAVAGPFDIGTVVTREALTLNPATAEVEVDGAHSDPIPHILEGIPLKLRDLRVSVDRPEFTLNATSCKRRSTRAVLAGSGANPLDSSDDITVPASDRYQAASCASLGFHPKLSLALKGGTKRAAHPALHSVLDYPPGPGYANIGRAVVTLPGTEFIDNAHIENPCTRVQFKAGQCPPGSVLGSARAYTPLLEEPLEGPVYFRSNGGERNLPDIVADLHGLFHIELVGFVDTATPKTNPRIRTTFASPPDAPVSKFELDLNGGKKGLLVNSASLCAKKRRASVALTGQNGRAYNTTPVVKTSCKAEPRHKKHKRHS